MPLSDVQVKVLNTETNGDIYQFTIEISNSSSQLAFFINPQLMNGDEEVLPSFWSDNYFSIPASGKKIITVSCSQNKIDAATASLKIEGWNIKPQIIPLSIKAHSTK